MFWALGSHGWVMSRGALASVWGIERPPWGWSWKQTKGERLEAGGQKAGAGIQEGYGDGEEILGAGRMVLGDGWFGQGE